jgi:hypothetical protein
MLPHVLDRVGDRVPHLARRPQHPQVVAIHKSGTPASERPVHSPREARGERLHSSAQRDRVIRLDHEVGMGALDGIVDDAEVAALGERAERRLDGRDEAPHAERRDPRANLERDERRMRGADRPA